MYIYIYIIYHIQQIPMEIQIAIATPPHRRAVSTMAFTMKPRGFQSALPRVVVTKVPQTTGSFDHFGRFGCVYSDNKLFFGTHFRWNWEAFHSFLMFSLQAKEIRVAKCAKGNPVLRPSNMKGEESWRRWWENDGIGKEKLHRIVKEWLEKPCCWVFQTWDCLKLWN